MCASLSLSPNVVAIMFGVAFLLALGVAVLND